MKKPITPTYIENDPWDGYFVKEFNEGLNSSIHKIRQYFIDHPKAFFTVGLALGGTAGFLIGVQTGTIIGLSLGKFFTAFA
jgi:hypothetical protein